MEKSIDSFFEKQGKYIGHIVNVIGLSTAIVAFYDWLNPTLNFWPIITTIVFLGLLLSMYRSRQLKQKVVRLNEALSLSNESTSKLMQSVAEQTIADIKLNGVIPITEMAALLHTLKQAQVSMGATPERLSQLDKCLDKLSEYEYRTRR